MRVVACAELKTKNGNTEETEAGDLSEMFVSKRKRPQNVRVFVSCVNGCQDESSKGREGRGGGGVEGGGPT